MTLERKTQSGSKVIKGEQIIKCHLRCLRKGVDCTRKSDASHGIDLYIHIMYKTLATEQNKNAEPSTSIKKKHIHVLLITWFQPRNKKPNLGF